MLLDFMHGIWDSYPYLELELICRSRPAQSTCNLEAYQCLLTLKGNRDSQGRSIRLLRHLRYRCMPRSCIRLISGLMIPDVPMLAGPSGLGFT
jgi:hypothetical protein